MNEKHREIDAYLAKTAYSKNGALNAELFYYDLNAFYWNWVACLCAVIAFLQPAIPIAMLAARGLENRVIFSERGNPHRLMAKRYGRKFIEKYYVRANAAVFQTGYAREVYPKAIAGKGVVIPNPLKPGLPAPFAGERRKRIVTFCRISREKNLPLLIRAMEAYWS